MLLIIYCKNACPYLLDKRYSSRFCNYNFLINSVQLQITKIVMILIVGCVAGSARHPAQEVRQKKSEWGNDSPPVTGGHGNTLSDWQAQSTEWRGEAAAGSSNCEKDYWLVFCLYFWMLQRNLFFFKTLPIFMY